MQNPEKICASHIPPSLYFIMAADDLIHLLEQHRGSLYIDGTFKPPELKDHGLSHSKKVALLVFSPGSKK